MKNAYQSGFSIVETLLVLVVIGIISFASWYVYHSKQASDNSYSAATNSKVPTYKRTVNKATTEVANPYAGWKSATLKYEKIAYQYPDNWTVNDQSAASNTTQGCVSPGFDKVTLTSPSNEQIQFDTGIDCIGDGGVTAFGSQSIKSIGQDSFLVFENTPPALDSNATNASYACLAQTAKPDTIFAGTSKNIIGAGSAAPLNRFCYYPYSIVNVLGSGSGTPSKSVASIKASADFNTAVLIFESMKYINS